MDLAYYKGMLTGLKDVMQTIGADWKIADLAPSMTALIPSRPACLACMKSWPGMPRPFPTTRGRIRGYMWKHATPLEFASWTLLPPLSARGRSWRVHGAVFLTHGQSE